MFNPRGIAIVGANPDLSRPGRQTVLALDRHGFKGGIYPVNPKYTEIDKYKCYPSLSDISDVVDVAVITLPAAIVPKVIEECGRKGIGFAVVVGGGFREVGLEGAEIEREMLEAAKKANVRIIGPNCLGYKNVHDNVFACFGSITRPPDLISGPVSALIQSGGYGNSMVVQCGYAGIGFRYLVASGSESDVKATDILQAFVDDSKTKIILLYLEGINDGREFVSIAKKALAAGKPIVVIKSGNTRQGQRVAASHTAFLTSSYDIYHSAFKQYGVIEVLDIGDAVDMLQTLLNGNLARGRNVAVMSGSGGSLVNFSDAADDYQLNLGPLTNQTRDTLRQYIPSIGSLINPIDLTAGYQKKENSDPYRKCIEAVLADPGIDQLGLFLATAGGENLVRAADAIVGAHNPEKKPIFIFSAFPPELTADGAAIFRMAQIPFLATPRRLAAAMSKLANYSAARFNSNRIVKDCLISNTNLIEIPNISITLDEYTSKKILKNFDIPVSNDFLFVDLADSITLPISMKYPVALKVVSNEIHHKSDVGGVKLGLLDDLSLKKAANEIFENIKNKFPEVKISGLLVSEMINDGLETIIGVVNDKVFGPVVTFGLGGIFTEIMRDTTYRLAPFDIATAYEMIGELRGSALFSGVRGSPPLDIDSLANALVNVSEFAWQARDRITEMDLNPVLVRPKGYGVVVVDALIITKNLVQSN